jgi:subtilisin family serine protease
MPNSLSRYAAIAAIAVFVCAAPRSAVRTARAAGGEFYYNAGRRVPIERSATRVAVRVPAGAAKADVRAEIAAVDGVAATRDVGSGIVEVTLATAAAKSPSPALADVARAAGGDLLPVFYEPGAERDASTLFVSDDLLARFRPGVSRADVDALGARLGFEVVAPLAYAPNAYRLRVVASDLDRNAVTAADACYETGMCEWAHPNFLAHRALRFVPNDPQFASQWHLANTGQGGGAVGADVKAEEAWEITRGSASISVAVADTGIDLTHEDLAVALDGGVPKIHDPRDVVHGDDDPTPRPGDADGSHGTAASGVAVAEADNALDTAGIAPGCRLVPIQLYAESTFTPNSTEADAFTWAADHADVMSNSWGPDNDDTPLPDATRAAIDYATSRGRGGKGTVIFIAAGNSNDDTVHDNYVSYPGVVAVAASNNLDTRAPYSRFGAAVAVAAPSSGGTLGIATTDVTGPAGYSTSNYTLGFGGTSSACPLAAGTAALVLSVDPDLTWSEVRDVLERSAEKIDVANGAYDATGRSPLYGFGRVDARAAVELARGMLDPEAPRVELHAVAGVVGAGTTVNLSWTPGGGPAVAQSLEYSADGADFAPIASVPVGTDAYAWRIPDDLAGTVLVRISVTGANGEVAVSATPLAVRARPTIASVKLKKSSSGKRMLVVDGAAMVVGEAVVYVDETPLGALKFPKNGLASDGTATRVISKDNRLNRLIPAGATVTITLRQGGGQTSAGFPFSR